MKMLYVSFIDNVKYAISVRKKLAATNTSSISLIEVKNADSGEYQLAVAKKYIGRTTERGVYYAALREIGILKNINHPHITSILGVWLHAKRHVQPVFEYGGITLLDYCQRKEQAQRMEEAPDVMKQCLKALQYIHELGILHRDIKPSNILINQGHVRLCDFGGAKRRPKSPEFSSSVVCAINYRAPEILCGEEIYSSAVDIWALACTMYAFIRYELLFIGPYEADVLEQILLEVDVEEPSDLQACGVFNVKYSKSLYRFTTWANLDRTQHPTITPLLKRMLNINPHKRPIAARCLETLGTDVEPVAPTTRSYLVRRPIQIDWNLRMTVVILILDVNNSYDISPYTPFTAVDILDAYLMAKYPRDVGEEPLFPENILYVGLCCLIIASKYCDQQPIPITEFCVDRTLAFMMELEREILDTIEYDIDRISVWEISEIHHKESLKSNEERWDQAVNVVRHYYSMVHKSQAEIIESLA